jgi:O-6-methylguanine DNA methyltransferase
MQCRSVLTRVDALRTGELEHDESSRLERHLASCPSCNESFSDVTELAATMKSLVATPPRSCREAVCGAVRDSFGVVETGAFVVRVAFAGEAVRMIDASGKPESAFRAKYARRFGRELVAEPLPPSVRHAVGNALEGHAAKTPPVDLSGTTEFEREVLETLRSIPLGEVRSYEWVAGRIGRPRAVRAVGNALAKNPVPLILPCHRVVPSTGGVGQYAFGSSMKRTLLEAEGAPLARLESLARRGVRFLGSPSTGVFCVPACPGEGNEPDLEHCTEFRTAGDALRNGYRPCPRCRPVAEVA